MPQNSKLMISIALALLTGVAGANERRYTCLNLTNRSTDTDAWVSNRAVNVTGPWVMAQSSMSLATFRGKTLSELKTKFEDYLDTYDPIIDDDAIVMLDIEFPTDYAPHNIGDTFFESDGSGGYQLKSGVATEYAEVITAYQLRAQAAQEVIAARGGGARVVQYGVSNLTMPSAPNALREFGMEQFAADGAFDNFDMLAPQCYWIAVETTNVDSNPNELDVLTRIRNTVQHSQTLVDSNNDPFPLFPLLKPCKHGSGGAEGQDPLLIQKAIAIFRAEGVEEYGFWNDGETFSTGSYADIYELYEDVFSAADIDGEGTADSDDLAIMIDAYWYVINSIACPDYRFVDYDDDGDFDYSDWSAWYSYYSSSPTVPSWPSWSPLVSLECN